MHTTPPRNSWAFTSLVLGVLSLQFYQLADIATGIAVVAVLCGIPGLFLSNTSGGSAYAIGGIIIGGLTVTITTYPHLTLEGILR